MMAFTISVQDWSASLALGSRTHQKTLVRSKSNAAHGTVHQEHEAHAHFTTLCYAILSPNPTQNATLPRHRIAKTVH